MRRYIIGLATLGALSAAVAYAGAPMSQPAGNTASPHLVLVAAQTLSGTIDFSGGQIAAGIGYSWGRGTLTYQGQKHAFHLSGLSVANVGASTVTASGKVYSLNNLADFSGNYVAAAAGATVGGGGSVMELKNEHGVTIDVISTQMGLNFQLSANGVKITLD